MIKIKEEEMKNIVGGTSISYITALNTVLKAIGTLFNVGQAIGSAIGRSRSGNTCSY